MERVYRSGPQSRQYGPATTDCGHKQMDSTDTLRGGIRHELTVELGAVRELDSEGDRVRQWIGDEDETVSLFSPPSVDPQLDLRTGMTHRFAGIWGCTHVTPVAGGAETAQGEAEGEYPTCKGSHRGGEPRADWTVVFDDRESEPLDRLVEATASSAAPEVTGDV